MTDDARPKFGPVLAWLASALAGISLSALFYSEFHSNPLAYPYPSIFVFSIIGLPIVSATTVSLLSTHVLAPSFPDASRAATRLQLIRVGAVLAGVLFTATIFMIELTKDFRAPWELSPSISGPTLRISLDEVTSLNALGFEYTSSGEPTSWPSMFFLLDELGRTFAAANGEGRNISDELSGSIASIQVRLRELVRDFLSADGAVFDQRGGSNTAHLYYILLFPLTTFCAGAMMFVSMFSVFSAMKFRVGVAVRVLVGFLLYGLWIVQRLRIFHLDNRVFGLEKAAMEEVAFLIVVLPALVILGIWFHQTRQTLAGALLAAGSAAGAVWAFVVAPEHLARALEDWRIQFVFSAVVGFIALVALFVLVDRELETSEK